MVSYLKKIRHLKFSSGITNRQLVIIFLLMGIFVIGSIRSQHNYETIHSWNSDRGDRTNTAGLKNKVAVIESLWYAQEHHEKGVLLDSININQASMEELQVLPGIGPALASRIVDFRKRVHKFRSTKQLLKVKGIGNKKLEKIKPYIKLN